MIFVPKKERRKIKKRLLEEHRAELRKLLSENDEDINFDEE